MSHTINVTDLADQDAVHRVLSEMKNYGVCYSLIQNEIEVARIVPVEVKKDETPGEIRKARLEALAGMDELAKKITALWSTDETATEAVANNRR